MNIFKDKSFLRFLITFLIVFAICYYGTLAVIGFAAPGDYYSPFIDHYLDYVSLLRSSLLNGAKWMLSLFGIEAYRKNDFVLNLVNGRGVMMVYSCVGYGVMSFWIAFVTASASTIKYKIGWILLGLLIIWLINISRISLLLVAINKGWKIPLGIDHHTWFNIVAYAAIFLMMYCFGKVKSEKLKVKSEKL